MDSDLLGIDVDRVKTQLTFIITTFHKAQLNSNSTPQAEPVVQLKSDSLLTSWVQFSWIHTLWIESSSILEP